MHSSKIAYWFVSLLLCFTLILGLGSCARKNLPTLEKKIQSHMDRCTKIYGYDPEKAINLEENELGFNEKQWRECLYEGIRTVIIPNSFVPEMYDEFIDQDRKMTKSIEKGEIARSYRKNKNKQFANLIKQKEEKGFENYNLNEGNEIDATMKSKVELDMKIEFFEMLHDSFIGVLAR